MAFTAIPDSAIDTGSPITEQLMTWIRDNLDDLDGRFFSATTAMVFFQASAPTGWTKSTANNDKVLRVVSGSGGGTGGSHSISSPPTHTHTVPRDGWSYTPTDAAGRLLTAGTISTEKKANNDNTSGATTGFSPYYIDVIVCTKN